MIRDLAISMAIAFALVATRMSAFVAVSPFPGPLVPTKIKIGLVLLLAASVAPIAPPAGVTGPGGAIGPGVVLATLAEAATGAAIGFVFRIGMSAAEVVGATLAHAMGLTFASSYDPLHGSNDDPLARILTGAATLGAFAVGAHRVVIGAVIASVRIVPLGSFPDPAALLPGLLTWTSRSIDCGLGLAMPVLTVSLAVQLSLGLVARAAPSLQIFSVGLALMFASGFLVFAVGAGDTLAAVVAHLAEVPSVLERIVLGVR
ncbi:MAG: flagellar biosynthetic protein FliR [Labilithrix sp.]|nr:flagellar biosynthetic protein FliR [Labilithrix sp.]